MIRETLESPSSVHNFIVSNSELMRGYSFKPVFKEVSWLFVTERIEELKNRFFGT
jgi:hypothetical protein